MIFRFVNNGIRCAVFDGFCGKTVAIKVFALQSKKDGATFDIPAIGRNLLVFEENGIEIGCFHFVRK